MSEEAVNPSEPRRPAPRLMRQMQIYSRVQYAFSAALLLALGVFALGVYRPARQQLDQLNWDAATKRLELAADRSQTDRLPREAIELAQLKQRLAGFKKLPADPQLGEFIHDVHQASERAALVKLVVEPQAGRRDELFSEQPIDLSFTGNFTAVWAFIGELEDMRRLTRLGDLSIHCIDGSQGTVQVKLSVNIYYGEAM